MNTDLPPDAAPPKEAEAFRAAMKQILSVPKAEIDRREAEYQKERATLQQGRKAQK